MITVVSKRRTFKVSVERLEDATWPKTCEYQYDRPLHADPQNWGGLPWVFHIRLISVFFVGAAFLPVYPHVFCFEPILRLYTASLCIVLSTIPSCKINPNVTWASDGQKWSFPAKFFENEHWATKVQSWNQRLLLGLCSNGAMVGGIFRFFSQYTESFVQL